jgi:hypothetical protein
MSARNCLKFLKGGHQYVFCWGSGQEAQVVAAFVELARDPRSAFTWLDAAVLSRQLGSRHPQPGCGATECLEAQLAITWFDGW